MKPVDREGLKAWYRNAMRGRVRELEELRPALLKGDPSAASSARAVGHALKGSGGSFGFPEVSAAAALLEDAPPHALARRSEGMIALLRRIGWPQEPQQHRDYAWLAVAVGLEPGSETDAEEAWRAIAAAVGITQEELATRAADCYGLETSDVLVPTPQALRLVPEALLREHAILPLTENGVVIRVAACNPTVHTVIRELHRLTGRRPDFVVVPPGPLRAALAGVLDDPARTPAAPARAARTREGPQTVLLVDDDPTARVIAKSVLEKKSFKVLEASDGEAGLATLQGHPEVLLAVVDLEMPGMGGRELVRAIRAAPDTADIPLVVLTGSQDPVQEADLIEDGADDYIRKPLDPRLFMARITSTLRRLGS